MAGQPSSSPKPAWQNAFIFSYATIALVLDEYRTIFSSEEMDAFIFYLLIPLLLLFRCSLKKHGVAIGNWKRGLLLTVGGWTLMAPILWFVARQPDFRAYYTYIWQDYHGFPGIIWWAMKDLIGWEFFFRGFLLFAFAEIAGPWAILLQAILFTFGHIGKPELETLSCIFGGSAFGWVAWETRSFFYPFLIRLFIGVFTVWVAAVM